MGEYVFGVAGDGCGCRSKNISNDSSSVECSGWSAMGQNCSFEVRTLSQDCGLPSDPITESISLASEQSMFYYLRHNISITLLFWYRASSSYRALGEQCALNQ